MNDFMFTIFPGVSLEGWWWCPGFEICILSVHTLLWQRSAGTSTSFCKVEKIILFIGMTYNSLNSVCYSHTHAYYTIIPVTGECSLKMFLVKGKKHQLLQNIYL